MNIKQSLFLFSSLFLSFSAMSASKWLGDWFEVEVILISQLDDKAKLKEIFSEQEFSLNYNNAIDLLSPYLNPDIATLKQQLPLCYELNDERNYLEQATIWPSFHLNKSLSNLSDEQLTEQVLAQEQTSELVDGRHQLTANENENSQTSENTNDSQLPAQPGDTDDFFDRIKTKQEQLKEHLSNVSNDNGLTLNSDKQSQITEQALLDEELLNDAVITEKQKALVLEARQVFSKQKFNYSSTFPVHYKSMDTDKQLPPICYISQSKYEQLNVDRNLYSYNGFLVNKMPTTINNVEDIFSEKPYLVSDDSLKLKDIVKQLRRSKDFRPLLHLAWRQPVYEKESSKPIKIFAGDNIQGEFAKSLATYQAEKSAELLRENALNTIFTSAKNIELKDSEQTKSIPLLDTENTSEKAILAKIKAEKINEILQQVSSISDVEEVVETMVNLPQDFGKITHNAIISTEPTPPAQPWYVEGLMEVYLIGNYLHVSNDFSILNMTLAEQESLKLKINMLENTEDFSSTTNITGTNQTTKTSKVIPIRMTQNRRMISREVHYFDHPHMGIIVQIRRHQRPELPLDDEQNLNSAAN
jgi:hypothetical protein